MENTNVKFVQFEDLIYKYTETVSDIEMWLQLNEKDHIRKKKIFNPDLSRKNTKTWIKYENNEKEKMACMGVDVQRIVYLQPHTTNQHYGSDWGDGRYVRCW